MQVRVQWGQDASAVVHLAGDLTIAQARAVYERLTDLAGRRQLRQVVLDFAEVDSLDSAGMVAITVGRRQLQAAGKQVTLEHLAPHHVAAFRLVAEQPQSVAPRPAPTHWLERLGEHAQRVGHTLDDSVRLVGQTLDGVVDYGLRRQRLRRGTITEQAVASGVDAFPIVALLSLLIGLILGFQSAFQLQQFGAEVFMAEIVGLGMVREFGPLMTAIILSGRSGAAMTAELATMSVREEIDALRTMGIDPVRFLVLPRLLALTLAQPVLTLMSIAIGIAGGIAAAPVAALPVGVIYLRMVESLTLGDFWLGLGKSVLFSWIIVFTACQLGLSTRGGAQSVGHHTTRTVVMSIFLVVVTDAVVTTLWTLNV